jgi:antitoxin component of MazEF toxin-antitoxin module
MESTIHKYGEKLLIDLPIELAHRLGWEVGDLLSIDKIEGVLKIERTMTAHDHTLKIADECMDEYREAFEKLAKS